MPKSIGSGHFILAGKNHVLVELQGIETNITIINYQAITLRRYPNRYL